jgi:hypothetical protein
MGPRPAPSWSKTSTPEARIRFLRSNGMAAGTFLVWNINPGSKGSYPINAMNVNGMLFFAANDGVRGPAPWILGPLPASAPALPAPILPPAAFSAPAAGAALDAGAAGLPLPALVDQQSRALHSGDNNGPGPSYRELASLGTGTTEAARRRPAVLATKSRSRSIAADEEMNPRS